MTKKQSVAVLVTTQHRGVFYGRVPTDQDMTARTVRLENARMAIHWGTTGGVLQLAKTGPTSSSRIGSEAPWIVLQDVTSITGCTAAAEKAWEK